MCAYCTAHCTSFNKRYKTVNKNNTFDCWPSGH